MKIRFLGFNIILFVGCVSVISLTPYGPAIAASKADCDSAEENCRQISQKEMSVTEPKSAAESIPIVSGKKPDGPTPTAQPIVHVKNTKDK